MIAVIVGFTGIVAGGRASAIEQDTEREDRIPDIDPAVVVAITAGEAGVVEDDGGSIDERGRVRLAATGSD